MQTRQPVVTRVGINSLLALVITVTPNFLGTTYTGLTQELSEIG